MYRILATAIVSTALLAGCGGEKAATPAAPSGSGAKSDLPQPSYEIPMRNFASVKIGPYDVQPMFEEEIKDGHYNIKIEGGEVKAVRLWVGPEDASGVMVAKTAIENDYQHGHVELPDPIPADAKLWIEIENPAGETFKGATPLKMAS